MIDLHIHSTCSDGSDDVETLIENINKNNINCFALTDHDTAEGCRRILKNEKLVAKLKENKQDFIVGAEWSCIFEKQKMHILAYGFDPFDERILAVEQKMRDMLNEKDRYRLNEFEKMGFVLSEESKKYLQSKENVRSMDFAKCLISDGFFSEIQEAFKNCINTIKYPFSCRFDAIELIKIMKSCGAKVVWAHSIYDLKRKITPYDEVERIIKKLKPYGLDGLECYYSLYSEEEINTLIEIAKRNDLFITCGSDYHGENKEVGLGCFSADGSRVDPNNIKIYEIFEDIIRKYNNES